MLLSMADLRTIQKHATLPAFGAAMQRLRSEVADFLARPVPVPEEPAGYYHDYFCPEHGVQLLFDPARPQTHRCPIDQAHYEGERFDAAWRWFVNNRLAESAIRLALLWRLEGNPAHLAPVTRLLSDYAANYARYQQVPRAVENPGVATYTTLDESVWVLPLAWAFDMVREQLSPDQQSAIADQLFAPVADHLIRHHFGGIHNFACWHNAAIGTIGVLLGRTDLIDFALHSEFGCDRQLAEGVLADGLWYEGSFSYHFYTVYAFLSLAKALRHLPDYDLRHRPELKAMLLAPLYAAYPDGSLPATNDCWYFSSVLAECCHGVPAAPAFYEIAYAWFQEPLFGQTLQRAYRTSPRESLDALLFGCHELPVASLAASSSLCLRASGYAILRSQVTDENEQSAWDDQRYLLLKYGPHGGGHGHPDKLNLILYAYAQRFSPDWGTPGYGIDLFESWYRQTACHNTVTLDGQSQPEATGRVNQFVEDGLFQVADASVSWEGNAGPYAGAMMRRILLARPHYFLDLFLVETPQPRRVDWFYHNSGRLDGLLPQTPYPAIQGEGDGYAHILQASRQRIDGNFQAEWRTDKGGLRLFAAEAKAGELIWGLTPGNPPSDQAVTLIQRQYGEKILFFSLFHPFRSKPVVRAVEWIGQGLTQDGWVGCKIACEDEEENWLIHSSAAQPEWFSGNEGKTWLSYRI